ncbi:hypothetical protein [uncultured Croceitalea sp.]|uniref:hypothetical protein n=1 Tax=uncultured Croceitalea sp. TaxID=1798908 RepID=UPI003305A8BB
MKTTRVRQLVKAVTIILSITCTTLMFAQSKKQDAQSSDTQELRLEFNVMKNISFAKNVKYDDHSKYRFIENGIYEDLNDDSGQKYRMTVSYELEFDETNNQYPLEDILDRYLMHVSDFLKSENGPSSNRYVLELAGYLDKMKEAKEIIGKRVFNREIKSKDGKIRVGLVIE